jgi:hypothetical protein
MQMMRMQQQNAMVTSMAWTVGGWGGRPVSLEILSTLAR